MGESHRQAWWRHFMRYMLDKNPTDDAYNVVVLGGGPAGSATALALKRLDPGLRVALVERTDYSAIRIGETLAPPGRALLAELGVWDAFAARSPMKSYGTRAAWGSPELYENEFIFSTHGDGWHLDRREFDAFLSAEAWRAGVEVMLRAKASGQLRREQRWNLTIQGEDSGKRELSARFVVDATGRRSWFAHSQGVRHQVYDRLAGVFAFLRLDPAQACTDTYASIEACEQGWWYSAVLPDHRMVVAFMGDADTIRRLSWQTPEGWRSLTASAPHTRGPMAGAIWSARPALWSASSQRIETPIGDNWLAVGDAAGTFDPLSSQGIIKGMRNGIYAARVIVRHLRGDSNALEKYAAVLGREYNNYLDARAAYYRVEQRWPDSPFWQRRQEVITLHPQQLLRSRVPVHASAATRLPRSQVSMIVDICSVPRTASEVVKQIHGRIGAPHSDRQIVLALQQLAEEGVLTIDPVHTALHHSQETLVRRNANAL